MNEVRLDPQQIPARAELLLAAEFGADAPGRPIYARPEPDGHDEGEPAARIKVGLAADTSPGRRRGDRDALGGGRTATRYGAGPRGVRACRSGPRSSPGPTRWTPTAGASTA